MFVRFTKSLFDTICVAIAWIKPHFASSLVNSLSFFLCHIVVIHFTLVVILIHDSIQQSNVIVLKSILNSISICLERPCIRWHPFTSSHHDFDLCIFHFYFTSFDLITMNVCCAYDIALLSQIHMVYSWAFLQWDHFVHVQSLVCVCLIELCFNHFIISYPHSTNAPPFSWRVIILSL